MTSAIEMPAILHRRTGIRSVGRPMTEMKLSQLPDVPDGQAVKYELFDGDLMADIFIV
jgi:hypothetical protein